MGRFLRSSACVVAALPCLLAASQEVQAPTFRGSVGLVAVDVQVVDRDGVPIAGLGPRDFEVSLDRQICRVVSAELIRYATASSGGEPLPVLAPTTPAEARRAIATNRTFILAIDESSFSSAAMGPALQAVRRFLSALQPADLVGLYLYPYARPALAFTHNHADVSRALDAVVGRLEPLRGTFGLSVSEIVDITRNDAAALARVVARECTILDGTDCPELVRADASLLAGRLEAEAAQSLTGLRVILKGLGVAPGRKTVVIISGGLTSSDRGSGRPDIFGMVQQAANETAASSANLYVLHVDNSFFDLFSITGPSRKSSVDRMRSQMRDSESAALGLEQIAGQAGGSLLRVRGGTADSALERILRETSAYYLLGVEPVDAERDGKLHFIRVKVNANSAVVQHRTQVVIPKKN